MSLLFCGCASAPVGTEDGEGLARALARLIRLHYEQRLARMDVGEDVGEDELRAARARLDRELRALGAPALGESTRLDDTVAATRNELIGSGYVFLPTKGSSESGLALARVLGRQKGLQRTLWGRTVRYRRVMHDSPIVTGFAAYAAVRLGEGGLVPLGRTGGPTVYLDRAAIRRRAGERPYEALTSADLAELVELVEVATMRFAEDVRLDELIDPEERSTTLVDVHARILLTTLRYGETGAALARLRAVSIERPGRPSELVAAARRVRASLGDARDPATVRERAAEIYGSLKR